jgi:hypothetical protein
LAFFVLIVSGPVGMCVCVDDRGTFEHQPW